MKSFLKSIVVKTLIWEAKVVLKKYHPKVIAITGSVGKTGTKDAIYTLLASREHTRKSEKSFNSEIGVPLTILGLPNAWDSVLGWMENFLEGLFLLVRRVKYPSWLVLEIGVDHPGDINRFNWLRPHIVLFTAFPNVPVHVEYFESPEEVTEEKRTLKTYLRPEGTLIINADDAAMQNETVLDGQHIISYGFAEHATVRGTDYIITYENGMPTGISFTIAFQDTTQTVAVRGVLGYHHMYPILGAVAVFVAEGKTVDDSVAEAFTRHTLAPGRMRILHGMNGSVIIDDTYNSSPVAVRAGMEALNGLEVTGKKIVVMGDMLELGDYSVESHTGLAQDIAGAADVFVGVGIRMHATADAVRPRHGRCERVESFKTATEAIDTLQQIIQEGDVVFVKGSQGMRMERIVEHILKDPQSAVQCLPRQDVHWKAKK